MQEMSLSSKWRKSISSAVLFRTGYSAKLLVRAQYRFQCDKSAAIERKSLNIMCPGFSTANSFLWIQESRKNLGGRGGHNVEEGVPMFQAALLYTYCDNTKIDGNLHVVNGYIFGTWSVPKNVPFILMRAAAIE